MENNIALWEWQKRRNLAISPGRGGGITLSVDLKAKFLYLWEQQFNGDNLLSKLNTDIITVLGKDFTTLYIPGVSAATFSVPNTAAYKAADADDDFWIGTDVDGIERSVNGSFTADTNWTKNTGVTISGGNLVSAGGVSGDYLAYQGGYSQSTVYRVAFKVNLTSGNIATRFGGAGGGSGTLRVASGTYSQDINSGTTNGNFQFYTQNGFVGNVEYVSIQKVVADASLKKTAANMVAVNLTRTFIKYANSSPYDISKIGILLSTATLTDSDKDELTRYFQLDPLFFGVWNDYGYIKENR